MIKKLNYKERNSNNLAPLNIKDSTINFTKNS